MDGVEGSEDRPLNTFWRPQNLDGKHKERESICCGGTETMELDPTGTKIQ